MAKNLKRRGLALLMTIIMSISLLPINVMAEGDADSAGSASQTEESVSGDSSASTGDAATGDTSTGDAATGDTSTGDAATGDTSTGDAATGDTSAGDAATGDTSTGDAATGDTSTGDAATGDTSTGDTGTVTDPAAPVTPVAPVTPADPATPAVPEKTPEELAKEEADRLVAEAAAKAEADRLAAEAAAKAEADRLAAERAAFEAAYPEISGEKSFNNVTASVNAPFGAFPAGTTLTIEPVKNGFMEGVVSAVKSLFGADAATTLSTLMENVEAATAEDETATGAVAFNITFTDAEGNEIQPNAEYPVDVRFEVASDNEMVAESSQLQVFHMEDETSVATPVGEPQAITDSSVAQEISVSSDHFSIWVVGGVTEKPTATYTYYVNGAKYSEQIVKDGETLNQPEAPASTETGKIFVGWYTTAEGGELFTAFGATAVSKTQEINLYARFDTKYYVFYKESETGRVVATQEYANGAAVDTASVAYSVKADQALVGWSTNPTATAADKNLTVNGGNITLYPVVKNAHWITFNSNEGSPVDPMYVLSGESTGTLPASTRAGYKFDGWYTASGDKFTGGKLTENITLTAKWTAQESNYTVVYWQENADDNGYTYVEKVSRSGKTGDEATYKNKSYTGFKLNTTKTDAENVTISGDGTTIKNVYYSRNTYTLTFRSRDAICGKWHWHTDSCYVVASFSGIKFGEKTTSYWNQANNKVSSYLWFTTSNGSTAYSEPPTMPQKNLTVYGEYNAAVSYIYYYEKGTTKEIHPTFQLNRSGWTFSDEDYIVLPGFTFANSDGPSTSGGRYVGKLYYTRNNYNITFNTNGGPNVTAVNQIPYETNISGKAPGSYEVGKTTKTVNGETLYFAGWYDNEACAGDAFSFSGKTMPAKNLLLYAKWTSKTFTVTFDANGGTAVAAMETVPFGSTIDEEDTVTTRNGYTFGGWTLDGKPFSFGTPVTKDLALKAVWLNSEGYSVTYSAGEGSGSVTDSGKYAEGTQAQVSSAASLTAPTGKVFVGWADASGNVYYPGSLVTVPKNGVTLTAQWADVNKTASLTYDPNGGTHTGNHEDLTVTSITNNGTVTLASPASLGITHDGYKFDGWNTQKDGNGESFAAGAVVRVDNIGNNVLYAQWKQTAHTLTVNYVIEGGGVTAPATHTETVSFGSTYSVTSPAVTGYTPDVATVSGTMPDGNVTKTVTYKANSHILTVNYVIEGGGVAAPATHTETVSFGGTYSVTSPAVTGYTPDIATVSGTMPNSNVTETVTYKANSHTITYILNGIKVKSFEGEQSVAYGTSLSTGYGYAPTTDDLAGKKFDGWSSTTIGGTEDAVLKGALPASMPDADVMIYGVTRDFKGETLTINYYLTNTTDTVRDAEIVTLKEDAAAKTLADYAYATLKKDGIEGYYVKNSDNFNGTTSVGYDGTGNKSFNVYYDVQTYGVTASIAASNPEHQVGGSITSTTPVTVNKGESTNVTWTLEEGYELVSVTDNGKDVTGNVSNGSYTVSTITEKHDIVVKTQPITYSVIFKAADNGKLDNGTDGVLDTIWTWVKDIFTPNGEKSYQQYTYKFNVEDLANGAVTTAPVVTANSNFETMGFFDENNKQYASLNDAYEAMKTAKATSITYTMQYQAVSSVTFLKQDGNGKGVNNAKFNLYTDAACKNLFDLNGDGTADDKDYAVSTKAGDVTGTVSFTVPDNNTYFMKEQQVGGYQKNDAVYTLTALNGKVTLTGDKNITTNADGVSIITNYRVINWYVNMNGTVLDYSDAVKNQDTSIFSKTVQTSAVESTTGSVDYVAGKSTEPATTNETIRGLFVKNDSNYILLKDQASVPSDEVVLNALRNAGTRKNAASITTFDGAVITDFSADNLNTSKYQVLWYVVKDTAISSTDGFHVDGVLASKYQMQLNINYRDLGSTTYQTLSQSYDLSLSDVSAIAAGKFYTGIVDADKATFFQRTGKNPSMTLNAPSYVGLIAAGNEYGMENGTGALGKNQMAKINGKGIGSGNLESELKTALLNAMSSKENSKVITLDYYFAQLIHMSVDYGAASSAYTNISDIQNIFSTNTKDGVTFTKAPAVAGYTFKNWTMNGKPYQTTPEAKPETVTSEVIAINPFAGNHAAEKATGSATVGGVENVNQVWFRFAASFDKNTSTDTVPAYLHILKVDGKGDPITTSAATFALFDGENKVLSADTSTETGTAVLTFNGNVPNGTYTLKEINAPEGYKLTGKEWTVTVSSEKNTALEGNSYVTRTTYTASLPADAELNNDNMLLVENAAQSYTVTYKVNGNPVGNVETYDFGTNVTVRDKHVSDGSTVSEWTTADAVFVSGTPVTFKMPAKDVVINATTSTNSYHLSIYYVNGETGNPIAETHTESLAFNSTYSVTSPVIAGYTADLTVAEGKMPAKDVTVTVTYARDRGALTLNKVLSGGYASVGINRVFTFTITGPADVNGSYETASGMVTFANGTATVSITGANSLTIYGLPTGSYTVAEADASILDSTVTWSVSYVDSDVDASTTDGVVSVEMGSPDKQGAVMTVTNTYVQNSTPNPGPGSDPEGGYGPGETPSVVIPDTNTPTTDIPDVSTPTTEIPDEDVPLTEIPDEATPLALAPATGDNIILWVMAAAVSGLGLVWIAIAGKKRRDNNAQ